MAYDIKYSKSSQKMIYAVLAVIVVVVLVVMAWLVWLKPKDTGVAIETNKYQAVFLTNGQVYFGKLSDVSSQYLKLTDVYYLQTQSSDAANSNNLQNSTSQKSNVQLVKLGNEVHGPEDQMVITKDQVLFYENIKSDGQVGKLIQDSQSNSKSK